MKKLRKKWRFVIPLLLVIFAIEARGAELSFPPTLPDGKGVVTDQAEKFLKSILKLRPGVEIKTRKKKILAFLHPFYMDQYGYTPLGTFGSAVSEDGSNLYVTWNGNRGGADSRGRVGFDTCAMTVIHIPESERQP